MSLQAQLELARAYLALVDPEGARAALEQARGILAQRPDLGGLAPATRLLDERVGQITEATPVDLFPHTSHVEVVAVLDR